MTISRYFCNQSPLLLIKKLCSLCLFVKIYILFKLIIERGYSFMRKATVAIVGRPNVGKSTIFNRLIGERVSIVEDTPGVTRDRLYREVHWLHHTFNFIDTGGIELSEEPLLLQIRQQAEIAIEEADVIIFFSKW